MNKEEILKKSREENRYGDELEKAKKETALNNGYFIASLFLSLLAISCYLGITNGNVIIYCWTKKVYWEEAFMKMIIQMNGQNILA